MRSVSELHGSEPLNQIWSRRLCSVGIATLSLAFLFLVMQYARLLRQDRAIDARHVDLGEVTLGEAIQQVFIVSNETDQELTITHIFKTCHCQQLDLCEGTKVPAGEELEFTFGFTAYQPGLQKAKLAITTDSKSNLLNKMIFSVSVDVKPALAMSPSNNVAVSSRP